MAEGQGAAQRGGMMSDGGSTAPWWGQIRNAVWTLGPVTVAFFMLLLVLFGWLPSPMMKALEATVASLAATRTDLAENRKIISSIQSEFSEHRREVRENQSAHLRALRLICRNTAKSAQGNENCDSIY